MFSIYAKFSSLNNILFSDELHLFIIRNLTLIKGIIVIGRTQSQIKTPITKNLCRQPKATVWGIIALASN